MNHEYDESEHEESQLQAVVDRIRRMSSLQAEPQPEPDPADDRAEVLV